MYSGGKFPKDRFGVRTDIRADTTTQGLGPEYTPPLLKRAIPLVSEERLKKPGARMPRQELTDPNLFLMLENDVFMFP